jgi:hypothetical protein
MLSTVFNVLPSILRQILYILLGGPLVLLGGLLGPFLRPVYDVLVLVRSLWSTVPRLTDLEIEDSRLYILGE